ncbi:MAG: diguanylate cyclase [Chitinivibrionales bacterium]|nr:diguanylate cyclase [Chitinivibrionales bacterium]
MSASALTPRLRCLLTALSVSVYVIGFLAAYPAIESRASIIVSLPLIVGAGLYGMVRGLLIAFTMTVVQMVLIVAVSESSALDALAHYASSNGMGMALGYIAVAVIGRMRDQHQHLVALSAELERLSRIDGLTRVLNRRSLLSEARLRFKATQRSHQDIYYYIDDTTPNPPPNPANASFKDTRTLDDYAGVLSCAMVDIDRFKQVNDTYGHRAGDQVLERLGELLRDSSVLRETDIAGRYGGEEFVLVFPGTSSRNAVHALERLRSRFAAAQFSPHGKEPFSVTLSCGVSQTFPSDTDLEAVIARADKALYSAKRNGRNQVCVAEGAAEPKSKVATGDAEDGQDR